MELLSTYMKSFIELYMVKNDAFIFLIITFGKNDKNIVF